MSKKSKKVTDEKTGIVYDSADEQKLHKWLLDAGYNPKLQYNFIPGRRFRADFAFPEEKVVVECWGLDFYGQAGHNNIFTLINDLKRHLLAAKHGWTILYWSKGVTKHELISCLNVLLEGESIEDNI